MKLKNGTKVSDSANGYKRLCDRFEVNFKAVLSFSATLKSDVEVVEVSKTGFKAQGGCNIPKGLLKLKFLKSDDQEVEVTCEKVWQGESECGFRIEYFDETWINFISGVSQGRKPLPYKD